MKSELQFTAKQYATRFDSDNIGTKAEVAKHIFEEQVEIQNQLRHYIRSSEAAQRNGGHTARISDRFASTDTESLQVELEQYARLGHFIFAENTLLNMQGVTYIEPDIVFQGLLDDPAKMSKYVKRPKINLQGHLPRLALTNVNVQPLFEVLLQSVTAYNTEGNAELTLKFVPHVEDGHAGSGDLVIVCKGAKIDSRINVNKFKAIANAVLSNVWTDWYLLGTRLIAAIKLVDVLEGQLTPLRIEKDRLEYEVKLEMIVLPQ